jgi:hypothetical protein
MATTPPDSTAMPPPPAPGPPPPATPPGGFAPPGTPPAAPPQKNTLAWVLGGCGVGVVLVIILIVVSVRMFVRSHVKVGSNGDVDISVGGASIHAGEVKDLGLPIYPGAESTIGKGIDITAPGEQGGMSMAIYTSSDPIEKVDAWYRDKLSKDYAREVAGQNSITLGGKSIPMQNGSIAYISGNNDNMTMVSLTPAAGKTQISLMRVGGTARQPQ